MFFIFSIYIYIYVFNFFLFFKNVNMYRNICLNMPIDTIFILNLIETLKSSINNIKRLKMEHLISISNSPLFFFWKKWTFATVVISFLLLWYY